jgi:hypothetical protein
MGMFGFPWVIEFLHSLLLLWILFGDADRRAGLAGYYAELNVSSETLFCRHRFLRRIRGGEMMELNSLKSADD